MVVVVHNHVNVFNATELEHCKMVKVVNFMYILTKTTHTFYHLIKIIDFVPLPSFN